MMPPGTAVDFEQLYALKQFIDQLRQHHVAALRVFPEHGFNGFKLSEATPSKNRVSISSTATCVGSLMLAGVWDSPITPKGEKAWWAGREADYLRRLLRTNWTSAGLPPNNPFSVAFVVEAVCLLRDFISRTATSTTDQILNERVQFGDEEFQAGEKSVADIQQTTDYRTLLAKAVELLQKVLLAHPDGSQKREAWMSVLEYPPSAYLTQLAVRALKQADRISEQDCDRVANWAAREISTQISFIQAHSKNSDPLQLIYLTICLASYRSSAKESPNELELIRYGLKIFFQEQKPDGSWPLSRPLFHYPTTGSAYCYDYEALAQLFLCEKLYDPLFEFLPQISSATLALDRNKFTLKTGGFGWASDHHPQNPGPESWSTASVYLYLFALDRFLAEGIRRAIARELELPYAGVRRTQDEDRKFAPKFLDCPRSAIDPRSLKDAIRAKVVDPIKNAAPVVAKGQKLPDNVPVSAILFGPPGTSKTEIVDQVSDFIGWPAFTVDPSYFVQNGIDAIQAQSNKIFRMLSSAEEIIVLFDEFDEMVRDREDAEELLSRFLTTAMLPKLVKINKQRRIIFIVATNHIDSFDVAISRAGRFDYVIQMMPPTAPAKMTAPDDGPTRGWMTTLKWLKEKLSLAEFESDLADLTFLETKALVSRLEMLRAQSETKLETEISSIWAKTLERCTLRRPEKDNDSKNWKERCQKQASLIRFDD